MPILDPAAATAPPRGAGVALLLAFLAMVGGGILWSTGTPADAGTARHGWERGLLMAAIVLTAVGLGLLAYHLRDTAGYRLVVIGAATYAAAGVLGLAGEVAILSPRMSVADPVTVLYVVLAFVGQAVVGLGLARGGGGALAAAGWALLLWNLAWLVVLPLATPDDMYFPVLHHLVLPAVAVPLFLSR